MKAGKYIKIFLAIVFLLPGITVVHALDYHKDATNGERCDWCHGPHNVFGGLLNDVDSETLCLSCHDIGVDPLAPDATIHAPLSASPVTCLDCHVTHSDKVNHLGNLNTSLVRTTVMDTNILSPTFGTSYNVDFDLSDSLGPKFVNFDGRDIVPGARRICEVCHLAPPNSNPHVTSPIATDYNCTTSCHKHNNAFSGGGGGGP